jgi:hypothetical protein
MSFADFKEYLKTKPFGKSLLENEEKLNQIKDDLDQKLTGFVFWLTGLASAETAFMVSKPKELFTADVQLFSVIAGCFLISIFFGLLYHFLRIIYVVFKMHFYEHMKSIDIQIWGAELKKIGYVPQPVIKNRGNLLMLLQFISIKLSRICSLINTISFFVGSISLVFLTQKALFQF